MCVDQGIIFNCLIGLKCKYRLRAAGNRSANEIGSRNLLIEFTEEIESDMLRIMERLMECKDRYSYTRASGQLLGAIERSGIEPDKMLEFLNKGEFLKRELEHETLRNLDGWSRLGEMLSQNYLRNQDKPWPEIAMRILAAKGRSYSLQKMLPVLRQGYDQEEGIRTGKLAQPQIIVEILSGTFLSSDESNETSLCHNSTGWNDARTSWTTGTSRQIQKRKVGALISVEGEYGDAENTHT